MAALKGFKSGTNSFFKAIPFIFKNNLWWTFSIPLVLNILLFISGYSLTDYFTEIISAKIDSWINISSDSKFMQAIPGFLAGFAKFLIHVAYFFIFAFFSGYIILILLSPLFAWLSEKTDKILNNEEYTFEFGQFIKDIWRGILIALRNLFYELGVTILILIATFIPFLGQIISPFTVIFYFLISSYFYGFSYMDYTCERKRFSVSESIQLIRKYRGVAVANGALFSFSLMLPFCGVLLAGFTAIISTVGATLAMNELPEIKERKVIKKNKSIESGDR